MPPADRAHVAAAVLTVALLAGCSRGVPAPHRVDTPPDIQQGASTIVVPVSARLADLQRGIDEQLPRTLWSIDRVEPQCVPAQRVKLFGRKLKVTPDLSCRIVGQVRRGAVTIAGQGDHLRLTLPVVATISARDVGGIVRQQTATGAATVHADVRLSVRPDWTPQAAVAIDYDWREAPGVTLFGKRITFTDKADARLRDVVATLERDLPRQLARLDVRDKVAAAWRQGFTSIMLNRDRPPVWLRITPRRVSYSGYRVVGDRLELIAAAQAVTETFVGDRPPDPVPGPLPPLARAVGTPSLAFQIPVLADYGQLEPVLLRALRKLAARGIALPHVGAVDTSFDKVTMYATDNGRLAVGVKARVRLRNGLLGESTGTVWLTGVPYNAPDSEVIEIRDLKLTGETNSHSLNLILTLFQQPALLDTIRGSLTQNFARDYAKVLGSARAALADKRQGDFVLSASIKEVEHGRVVPTGPGLFLPVSASGEASIAYRPATGH